MLFFKINKSKKENVIIISENQPTKQNRIIQVGSLVQEFEVDAVSICRMGIEIKESSVRTTTLPNNQPVRQKWPNNNHELFDNHPFFERRLYFKNISFLLHPV